MYRVNTLRKKVLITYDEIIDQAPVSHSADPFQIRHAIQIAEERFIVPLIGLAFYNDFREKKNTVVTALNLSYLQGLIGTTPILKEGDFVNAAEILPPDYQTLWNEHLWKITAESVYYVANPTTWARHEAAGVMLNNPQTALSEGKGAVSVTLKDLQWLQDNALMSRIEPLIVGMKGWLDANSNGFPYWASHSASCCGSISEPETTRKTAYINVYNNAKHGCNKWD